MSKYGQWSIIIMYDIKIDNNVVSSTAQFLKYTGVIENASGL